MKNTETDQTQRGSGADQELFMNAMGNQSHDSSSAAERRAIILPLDRFNAFSDGVFAIAITILVLELTVPPLSVPLPEALQELWPDFLGYFISFFYIGGIWISHSRLTCLMKKGDSISYGLNLLLLLFVALLPFMTRTDGHAYFHAGYFDCNIHLWSQCAHRLSYVKFADVLRRPAATASGRRARRRHAQAAVPSA